MAVELSGTLVLDEGSVDEMAEQLLSALSPTYPPTTQRHTLCVSTAVVSKATLHTEHLAHRHRKPKGAKSET